MKFLPSRQPTRDVSPRPSGYPDKADPREIITALSRIRWLGQRHQPPVR
jgi:hypothetical protein